jgi:hypothetical protein
LKISALLPLSAQTEKFDGIMTVARRLQKLTQAPKRLAFIVLIAGLYRTEWTNPPFRRLIYRVSHPPFKNPLYKNCGKELIIGKGIWIRLLHAL